jgi:tetratricopeptide (TPR) repeat protein
LKKVDPTRTVRLAKLALLPAVLGLSACVHKTVVVQNPLFPGAPVRQVTNAVDAGDGDLEIVNLRKTVASRPDDVDARLRLAQAYASRGLSDVALEHLRLAAERFPNSLPAALQLAQALRHVDQKEEALAGLKDFIHRNPQTAANPYEWLGILNDDVAGWKDSQLAYETALLYSPDNPELHNNLGYALLMQHLNNSAATEFRAALRLRQDYAIARNNLGIALADNPQEAILYWQGLNGPAVAHNNMAALLIERGDYKGARKELETALGFDRHYQPAMFNLALVAERDGKPAVLPAQPASQTAAKARASSGFLSKLLHPWRHDAPAKQVDNPSLPVGQSAERVVVPTGSAVGN